jgi:hypothetical protein
MKHAKLTEEQVIEKLKEGWELGLFSSWSGGSRAAMQERLCGGGTSHSVHKNTVASMLRRRVLEYAPRKSGDAFWLKRLRLGPRAPQ